MIRWVFALVLTVLLCASSVWAGDFLVLCYHDVADIADDPDGMTISTDRLVQHFSWLRAEGYQAVRVDDLLAAQRGERSLPDKAVLITFDDGYVSFHQRVLPLLKAFEMPAVLALEGSWLDAPPDALVRYGEQMVPRQRFLSWEQLREITASGLVEIASHGYGLHYGEVSNPQGNVKPAMVSRRYDPELGSYESDPDFLARIRRGLKTNSDLLQRNLGVRPRVMVWPFGRFNEPALNMARDLGMPIAMTLEYGKNRVEDLSRINRYLIEGDQLLDDLAFDLRRPVKERPHRAVQVDLDYVYDPDPEQQERNLGQLVDRIHRLQISTVYLQAFADPDGDGTADALYFPNRYLPMRADLFNRVAWQLITRAGVEVYAWLPILGFNLGDESWLVQAEGRSEGSPEHGLFRRLSPFDPRAREAILNIYEDLARHAQFDGLMFHDDGVLDDYEDAHPEALRWYGMVHGLPPSIAEIRQNPAAMSRWSQAKTQALIEITEAAAARVRIWRPRLKTARNIFASPVLDPAAETWFAQSLPEFLKHYDFVCVMAMPYMEQAADPKGWMRKVVEQVRAQPEGLKKTVFILQSRDWREPARFIPSQELAATMRSLQRQGALNFGYYPDDFPVDQPRAEVIHRAFSLQTFPHRP